MSGHLPFFLDYVIQSLPLFILTVEALHNATQISSVLCVVHLHHIKAPQDPPTLHDRKYQNKATSKFPAVDTASHFVNASISQRVVP